ncbi:putative serine--tRNA ligase DIA4 NDAI_0F01060 [Naumovozyma dairenensis CBS 421]|uniref:serine--tRNA ligase n=1 Tax=Naumovozyma dairenensis (strain ATCC 10597 / BCRC 20456 / CBS 421 / NBRC 0211 / NRRL Y-12639) TaxID=1071378 RepID=G0WCB4_NAUDC|nr:hypothetical protein NDAI_0F01060 [Naumovozyma dairenensis CBS 421]CCD25425.1 hypothetical protein NDAI_0F01060 [Naumovozyma dairenensis CBS 421]
MLSRRAFSSTTVYCLLKRPQFDINATISRIEEYEHSIKGRQLNNSIEVLSALKLLPTQHDEFKKLTSEMAKIQTERKKIESLIKTNKADISSNQTILKSLKSKFQTMNESITSLNSSMNETCSSLPNLLHGSCPLTEPRIVQWINPKETYAPNPQLSHVEIMTRKKMIDLKKASQVTGTSWYYLLNSGAELEMALVKYAIDIAKKRGFSLVIPPSVTRLDIINSCGFRPRDMNNENQIYKIGDDIGSNDRKGLIATAGISLAGLGYDEVINLDETQGIKKSYGVSRSYRAEAGARGKDTKGLYRVHEFTKVELFCWCKPELSEQLLKSLKNLQIEIITELGLSAKVLNMPANDLGNPAFMKYYIEAWMPGRGSFGEISSTSNCTDFQSRRLNTKYRDVHDGKLHFAYTLNGTAMAVPRIMLALVENFYDPTTDKIHIPTCLRPYMNDIESI